ncbi:ABC transporter substrate-binding protein [Nitrosopumilus sp.]|uniref:ABC transporter substrate-binding protein n=1 Tax=Nitrosopumilus sp. TaxID=2024843 RepID=UPI002931123A|nr:ABC transporter substrate-binding protein [Nitrosopumilus sp.]
MKSTQLLSVVFSLIMFTGVTAGNAAVFADSDDLEDKLEDFCEMTESEKLDFFSDYPDMAEYEQRLGNICKIEDEEQREDSLEELIDEIVPETRDDTDDYDSSERDYYYDNDKDKRHDYLEDRLEDFCELSDDEKTALFAEHKRLAQFEDRLASYCDLPEDEREDSIEEFIEEHLPETRDYDDDLEGKLERYCEMTDDEKQDFVSMHDKSEENVAKMNEYCELDEDQREAFIDEHEDEYKMGYKKDMRVMLDSYCEMSEQDRETFLAGNDKAAEHTEKMNRYCELDEDGKTDFITEHIDEYISHVKEMKMSDYKKEHIMLVDDMKDKHKDARDHKDYSKYCQMSGGERAEAIDDLEKLERISAWCEMTPEERMEYKKEHHDTAMDFKEKHHGTLDKMKAKHDLSPRLKEMIMNKHDISDERLEEIRMKYKEKYGDLTDEKKSKLEMKFKSYMSSSATKMSDEHKSAIHDRIAEMKAFKAELREKYSDMTDKEKQQLREEFIAKVQDMQLAWILPRVQMNAGLDAAEIECREGYSLLMKESNGVPMCLTADSALKMIEKGIAVPAN